LVLLQPNNPAENQTTPVNFTAHVWRSGAEVQSLASRWDFDGDGQFDTNFQRGGQASHLYTQPGTYQAAVQVKVSGQLLSTSETIVIMDDERTQPFFQLSVTPETGSVATAFTFRAVPWDEGDEVAPSGSIHWDWENDGIYDTPFIPFERENLSMQPVITHTFATSGLKIVRVQREGWLWSQTIVLYITP
jgi:PKD repeat protein